jgi:hypothetical protein
LDLLRSDLFLLAGWTGIRDRCPSGKSLAARERGKYRSAVLSYLSPACDANGREDGARRRVERFFYQDWTTKISLVRLKANLRYGDAAPGRGSVPK